MRGSFICFEGIDGSGKSSVAETLVSKLNARCVPAILASRSSRPNDAVAAERLTAVAELLWNYPPHLLVQSLGDRHLILLLASWYQLFDQFIVRPAVHAGYVVITDQWINKYIARFRVKQTLSVDALFEGLSRPDHVILLSVAPEVAESRKGGYRLTECEPIGGTSGFVAFQRQVARELWTCRDSTWLAIDASAPLARVSACAEDFVMRVLEQRGVLHSDVSGASSRSERPATSSVRDEGNI